MRWTWQHQALLRKTNDADADGEIVWSWRPDAGAKFAGWMLSHHAGDGGKQARLTGESSYKPQNHRAGKAGLSGSYLWFLPRAFFTHGGHGCERHPAFPAPSSIGEGSSFKPSGAMRRGPAEARPYGCLTR